MTHTRTKRLPQIIINQSLIGAMMFSLGLFVLFFAQGYRLNTKTFKIIKTGVLYVVANQKEASVFINGNLVSAKTPFNKNLAGGHYDVEVKKNGYKTWYANVNIQPELLSDYRNIILLKDEPIVTETNDTRKIDLVNNPIDTLATGSKGGLKYTDYEIWIKDTLIARYSEPIYFAKWYDSGDHIIYQQKNEVRIIESSGTNDTLILKLCQESQTNVTISSKGDEIYYSDCGKYKSALVM